MSTLKKVGGGTKHKASLPKVGETHGHSYLRPHRPCTSANICSVIKCTKNEFLNGKMAPEIHSARSVIGSEAYPIHRERERVKSGSGIFSRICIYSVSQKTLWFSDIFPKVKRLGIFYKFFTHLLCVPIYARLQIFIQVSPTLTKLCHTKRDHLANFFYISLEVNF